MPFIERWPLFRVSMTVYIKSMVILHCLVAHCHSYCTTCHCVQSIIWPFNEEMEALFAIEQHSSTFCVLCIILLIYNVHIALAV